MRRDTNLIVALTIVAVALSIALKTFAIGRENKTLGFLIDFPIALTVLAIVTVVNLSRIRDTVAAGRSPDFMIRPYKAGERWALFTLAGAGVLGIAAELTGDETFQLSGLSFLPIILMAIALRYTAYENPEA